MQLFVLLLVLGVLLVYEGGWTPGMRMNAAWMLAINVGGYLMPAGLGWLWCRQGLKKLLRQPERAMRALNRLHAGLAMLRWLTLMLFLWGLFGMGWLTWLREQLGQWILLNEVIVLALPLGVVVFHWWAYYPIERRLREQLLIRHLDEGRPLFGVPTRGQYVVNQLRHHIFLILIPMLLLVAWVQLLDVLLPVGSELRRYEPALMVMGAAAVFITAPLIIRAIWDTVPMPDGPLRQTLLDLCRRYGIRVRELLLWRTHRGLINGAVMGLVAPMRYILLTDGLVEQLDNEQIEAVMAHELGHVRRHHMPWMMVCALATLTTVMALLRLALWGLEPWIPMSLEAQAGTSELTGASTLGWEASAVGAAALLLMIGVWGVVFGYISRRFERQADTFAVQHLSRAYGADGQQSERITEHAAHTMAGALRAVCLLNNQPTSRNSWRHGSIDWRIAYLHSLVGKPIEGCDIDRHIRHLRWACLALLIATVAIEYQFGGM